MMSILEIIGIIILYRKNKRNNREKLPLPLQI